MIRISPSRARGLVAAVALAWSLPGLAQNPAPRPQRIAITNVRVANAEGDDALRTIVMQDGLIESVAVGGVVPPGCRVIDGEGLVAAPAFIDAYTQAGHAAPEADPDLDQALDTSTGVQIDMRRANRKGVRPSFRVSNSVAFESDAAESYRKAGFGLLLSAPSGEVFGGRSALLITRDAAARDLVVRENVFQHSAFAASGSGYPGTLMAYIAQLRQFLLDARHHVTLQERQAAGKPGPRPAFDSDLDAIQAVLAGRQQVVCEADSDRDARRWLRLGEEFGFGVALAGGRDAWQLGEQLAQGQVTVVLTLDWGTEAKDPDATKDDKKGEKKGEEKEAPEDEGEDEGEESSDKPAEEQAVAEPEIDFTYTEPIEIAREKRKSWIERRDCAMRLAEGGVTFLFGSAGDNPADLLKRVRTLVAEGLPRGAAMDALTGAAANFVGATAFGSLEAGKSATLCLWSDDPLDEKAQVRWAFIEGYVHEYEVKEKAESGDGPADGVDLSGTWTVVDPDDSESPATTLTIEMDEEGAVTGTLTGTSPMDGSPFSGDVSGVVDGADVSLSVTIALAGMAVEVTLKGEFKDGAFKGTRSIQFGGQSQEGRFEATKVGNDPNQAGESR